MNNTIINLNEEGHDQNIQNFLKITENIRNTLDTTIGIETDRYFPQKDLILESFAEILGKEVSEKIVCTNRFLLCFGRLFTLSQSTDNPSAIENELKEFIQYLMFYQKDFYNELKNRYSAEEIQIKMREWLSILPKKISYIKPY